MRAMTNPLKKVRANTLPGEFIWLKQLDADEQAEFFSGLLARILAAIPSSDWVLVTEWVEEWKATANVYADLPVSRDIKEGLEDLEKNDALDWEILRKELDL